MNILSSTEENYLKGVYHLSDDGNNEVSTNALADFMQTKPATVSDMIKRLSKKKLIIYEKYRGVKISPTGYQEAIKIIRKHRLWEVFLYDKLKFSWDEVHEIAEQLEHVKSIELTDRLDAFLGHPSMDPHGDPIPDCNGKFTSGPTRPLSELEAGDCGAIKTVTEDDTRLLQYLDKLGIRLGLKIEVIEKVDFDGSMEVKLEGNGNKFISQKIADQLLITKIE